MAAANVTDVRAYVLVLLGGEAGLRLGEMVALEWRDIDLVKRQLCVARSSWKEQVATPKGGRLRYVPLTVRLAMALRDNRHLRGPRVLYQDDGRPLTEKTVQTLVLRAARRAGLANNGPHILRHTFCSHLAMRGARARAIQELAGHMACRRRSATCTSVPPRSRARSGCSIGRIVKNFMEIYWKRPIVKWRSRMRRSS